MGSDNYKITDIRSVAITIATYARPYQLKELLDSIFLMEHPDVKFSVIVVDNDPKGTAKEICESCELKIIYTVETVPGISAARNRGLKHSEGFDAVVFVDDDELVSPQWLRSLVSMANQTGASVVAGPVIPVLPIDAPKWARRIDWFSRPKYPSGSSIKWPATNNSLVRYSALNMLNKKYFDQGFSLTGGEDAELFWRLRKKGVKIVWSEEAVVTETVPMARIAPQWIWRRGIRLGNVSGRLHLREKTSVAVFIIGIARIVVGITCIPLLLFGRGPKAAVLLMHLPKGIGTVQSIFGKYLLEYARK
ncbi:MAG: glycosyltransferase [Verrucomicrobiota bacterium]|nr:glycosyltransferase [Verrucomicrobiota bacterium]